MIKEEELKEEMIRALKNQQDYVRGNNSTGYIINQQKINTLAKVLELDKNSNYIE